MEDYEISWTARAVKDLKRIYHFYTDLIGEERAFELVETLVGRVETLSDKRFANMGAIDEEFSHLKHKYRKLIEGHIKVTYRLSAINPVVYVNRVFDTRQDPVKNR